jgi:hypothetical protein
MCSTAAAVMQRADPSCKIWFVCKEQLICTRYQKSDVLAYNFFLVTDRCYKKYLCSVILFPISSLQFDFSKLTLGFRCRDTKIEIALSAVSQPLLPYPDHGVLHLSTHQEEVS